MPLTSHDSQHYDKSGIYTYFGHIKNTNKNKYIFYLINYRGDRPKGNLVSR